MKTIEAIYKSLRLLIQVGLMYKTVQIEKAWGCLFVLNYHYKEGNCPHVKVSLQVTQTKPQRDAEKGLGAG